MTDEAMSPLALPLTAALRCRELALWAQSSHPKPDGRKLRFIAETALQS
jgi:hypothetical protein